jgi:hypothetical protein
MEGNDFGFARDHSLSYKQKLAGTSTHMESCWPWSLEVHANEQHKNSNRHWASRARIEHTETHTHTQTHTQLLVFQTRGAFSRPGAYAIWRLGGQGKNQKSVFTPDDHFSHTPLLIQKVGCCMRSQRLPGIAYFEAPRKLRTSCTTTQLVE